jgi:hypothetical protein
MSAAAGAGGDVAEAGAPVEPQHFLCFLPLPQGQGSFLPRLAFAFREMPFI